MLLFTFTVETAETTIFVCVGVDSKLSKCLFLYLFYSVYMTVSLQVILTTSNFETSKGI